ncbi:exported hypothetical protein [Candidatus Zixiibacteriota bacterium]|nr:exported hypothetical protein [candidate division Zixibacteria bacterium]
MSNLNQGPIFIFMAIAAIFAAVGSADAEGGLAGETTFNPGEILLRWTAPGDNGYTGRAAGYDIRYQAYSLGPLDTEAEWRNASRVLGEPSPSIAGVKDSMIVKSLVYGASFYFAMKTYDLAGNYSVLSNSPLVTAGDTLNCSYIPGDANADGYINIKDVACVVSYLYKEGFLPYPLQSADVDASGIINILDVSYVIKSIYHEGPDPVCY